MVKSQMSWNLLYEEPVYHCFCPENIFNLNRVINASGSTGPVGIIMCAFSSEEDSAGPLAGIFLSCLAKAIGRKSNFAWINFHFASSHSLHDPG